MAKSQFNTIIIRFGGEIGIKGVWTRKLYERRLIKNIRAVLKHYALPYSAFNRRFGRIYIQTPLVWDSCKKLSKIFGVSSLSPALETSSKQDEIVNNSISLVGSRLEKGKSFAVRCRRVGKHPYTSQDICREVGRRILEAYPHHTFRVDLTHPDVTLGIEIREERTFIYTDIIQGVGGLPLGTQQKVVCLFKGDNASAAACWLAMKRGCLPILTFFDSGSFAEEASLEKTLNVARLLFEWAVGFPRKLFVIKNSPSIAEILKECPNELADLVYRRLILRIAEQVATSKRAQGIITGDSIGLKPTQTVRAFNVQDAVSRSFPVHRPLLGFDAKEIRNLAQKIGINELKTQKAEKPEKTLRKPVMTSIENVSCIEEKLDIKELIKKSIETAKTLCL
jgi:thiamine biosynthesis protein ThiI